MTTPDTTPPQELAGALRRLADQAEQGDMAGICAIALIDAGDRQRPVTVIRMPVERQALLALFGGVLSACLITARLADIDAATVQQEIAAALAALEEEETA